MRVVSAGVCCLYGIGAWKLHHKGSPVLGLSSKDLQWETQRICSGRRSYKNEHMEGSICIKITSRMGQTILLALEMGVLPREGL